MTGFQNCITELNGGYVVNFEGAPATMFSTPEAARARLDQLIQNAYRNNIKPGESGGYTVRYGNNPTRMFSTREQAIEFLNRQVAAGNAGRTAAQSVQSGVTALTNGGYQVNLKGTPSRMFTSEAEAIKYYNKLVQNTLATSIIENADGTFDVKAANGPTRKFTTKEQAEAFLKKELGIKDVAKGKPHIAQKPKITPKPKAAKKGNKWALIGLGLIAIGAGVAALIHNNNKKATQQKAPAPSSTSAETVESAATQQYDDFQALKGSDFWKYAKMELTASHKDDPEYTPRNAEINEKMFELLERNNVQIKGKQTEPPLMVNDNVQLDKNLTELLNQAKLAIQQEHNNKNYEPTYQEVTKKMYELINK